MDSEGWQISTVHGFGGANDADGVRRISGRCRGGVSAAVNIGGRAETEVGLSNPHRHIGEKGSVVHEKVELTRVEPEAEDEATTMHGTKVKKIAVPNITEIIAFCPITLKTLRRQSHHDPPHEPVPTEESHGGP